MRKLAFIFFLSLFASCSVKAQFIGYTSPQTVIQKVFSGQTTAIASPATSTLPCPTNGNPCAIPNLGQSIHSVTYSISSPCTTGFFMDLRIEATQDGSTWFSISEDASDQTNSGSVQGASVFGLTAIGSYAGFRLNLVSIACSSGQTPAVSATYSGTSTSTPTPVGAFYQSSPYRKTIVSNSPTTSAGSLPAVTITSPTGSTAGALYVTCYTAATGVAAVCPVLTVNVFPYIVFGGGGGGNISSIPAGFPLGVTATLAPILQMATAPAVSMTFTFSGAGTAGVNWSAYFMFSSTPSSSFAADPCSVSGSTKRQFFTNITATGTSLFVSSVPGQTAYICSLTLNMIGTTTADTFLLETGTGNTCTTPTNISQTFSSGVLTSGATSFSIGGGNATMFQGFPGLSVCAVVPTVATGPNIAASITFVQQ